MEDHCITDVSAARLVGARPDHQFRRNGLENNPETGYDSCISFCGGLTVDMPLNEVAAVIFNYRFYEEIIQ